MEMTTRVWMRADPATIYRLAAAVEDWPRILPHYRSVRVLRQDGRRRLVEMAAHRDGFPVRWTAIQELHPAERRITFRHVRGVTRGMEVAWRFTPGPDGVLVEIWHAFRPPWPLVPDALVKLVIGDLFVENIAGKTLRRVKERAEAETATARAAEAQAAGARRGGAQPGGARRGGARTAGAQAARARADALPAGDEPSAAPASGSR